MVKDTPTGRHRAGKKKEKEKERNTQAPERLEQFTAGDSGRKDSPAGPERERGGERGRVQVGNVGGVYTEWK